MAAGADASKVGEGKPAQGDAAFDGAEDRAPLQVSGAGGVGRCVPLCGLRGGAERGRARGKAVAGWLHGEKYRTARRGSRGNQARVKARFPLVTEKKHPLPTIVGRGCGEGGAA